MPLATTTSASSGAALNGSAAGDPAAYRTSQDDIMRMKSVHLDRKLSATARLPKRSTIIESPSGKYAQPRDINSHSHSATVLKTSPSSNNLRDKKSSTGPPPLQKPSYSNTNDSSPPQSPNTVIRPSFARNNTNVQIIDHLPRSDDEQSPTTLGARGYDDEEFSEADEGLTLGDIPQLLESEQAREQHRSLPRQSAKPAIAELTPLELMIVKHFAVLALHRSSLKDHFDLDEILELLETKKSTFWNKIFKGNDKKNVKKKGTPSLEGTCYHTLRSFGV